MLFDRNRQLRLAGIISESNLHESGDLLLERMTPEEKAAYKKLKAKHLKAIKAKGYRFSIFGRRSRAAAALAKAELGIDVDKNKGNATRLLNKMASNKYQAKEGDDEKGVTLEDHAQFISQVQDLNPALAKEIENLSRGADDQKRGAIKRAAVLAIIKSEGKFLDDVKEKLASDLNKRVYKGTNDVTADDFVHGDIKGDDKYQYAIITKDGHPDRGKFLAFRVSGNRYKLVTRKAREIPRGSTLGDTAVDFADDGSATKLAKSLRAERREKEKDPAAVVDTKTELQNEYGIELVDIGDKEALIGMGFTEAEIESGKKIKLSNILSKKYPTIMKSTKRIRKAGRVPANIVLSRLIRYVSELDGQGQDPEIEMGDNGAKEFLYGPKRDIKLRESFRRYNRYSLLNLINEEEEKKKEELTLSDFYTAVEALDKKAAEPEPEASEPAPKPTEEEGTKTPEASEPAPKPTEEEGTKTPETKEEEKKEAEGKPAAPQTQQKANPTTDTDSQPIPESNIRHLRVLARRSLLNLID